MKEPTRRIPEEVGGAAVVFFLIAVPAICIASTVANDQNLVKSMITLAGLILALVAAAFVFTYLAYQETPSQTIQRVLAEERAAKLERIRVSRDSHPFNE